MSPAETARLLAAIAAFDQRTVGKTDVVAWHTIMSPIELPDALAAVTAHYAASRNRIMPADVVERATVIQREREQQLWRMLHGHPFVANTDGTGRCATCSLPQTNRHHYEAA